jgi:hypothetical protein
LEKEHVQWQLADANDDKTDAAYNYARFSSQRKAMMQWWADYLDENLEKESEAAHNPQDCLRNLSLRVNT